MFKTALGLGLASSVAFLLMTSLAAANPITWNLQNMSLVGGGAITGSFTFDPTTDIYSNININTPSAHYGIPNPSSPGNANVLIAVESGLTDYTGTPTLAINWATPLTNAGGTASVNLTGYTFQGICGNTSCTTGTRTASFASGSATTAITWHLQNATLVGGGAVTGSFAFNPYDNTYSNININTPSAHYGIPNPSSPGNANVLIAVESGLTDYTGTPTLAINWATPLTNAGGTDPFNLTGYTFQGICGNTSCTTGTRTAYFAAGSATNVPEPSSLSLLAFGLLGLMGFAYRSPRVRV